MDAPPPPPPARLPGGELPEIGRLFQETLKDLQDHFGDHLIAGAVYYGVVLVAVLAGVMIGYVAGFFGTFALIVASAAVMVWAEQTLGQDAAAVLAIPLELTVIVLVFLGTALVAGLFGAVLAPLNASMYRAVAAHQRGEGKLQPAAPFSTIGERWTAAVTSGLAFAALTVLGVFFCYVPALLVPIVFGFAMPLVALHPVGGFRALAWSARLLTARPNWALPFGLVMLVAWMISGNLPIVGPMFAMSLQVRAYRYVFGDGPEADLRLLGSSSGDTNTQ